MYDITMQQLIYFFIAAEYLNFSKAADHMYIAQSALSKWISKLETSLGVKLFDRVYRGVKLTEAGTYLYNNCRPLVDDLCKEFSYIQSTWRDGQKKFTLNCMTTLHSDPSLLKNIFRYKSEHPSISFAMEILEMDLLRMAFCNRECNACIAPDFVFGGLSNVKMKRISSIPICINIAKSHPLALNPNLTLSDLRDETFCMMPIEGHGSQINQKAYEVCDYFGFVPKKINYTKNHAARETAILMGCISIGSGPFTSEQIIQIPIDDNIAKGISVIAWHADDETPELLEFTNLFEDMSPNE